MQVAGKRKNIIILFSLFLPLPFSLFLGQKEAPPFPPVPPKSVIDNENYLVAISLGGGKLQRGGGGHNRCKSFASR